MAGPGPLVSGFVGRTTELRLLDQILNAATDGVGSVMSVTGPAGIGKTWFCGEAIRRGRARGFATVRGACWPDGGAPPLWPWQDLLRELIDDAAARLLVNDGGGGRLDPERFTRFLAVRDRLAGACARRPAVVVVDDMHDADPGAVLLGQFIGRQVSAIPLVLILSRRGGGRPDDHAVPVELRGFDATEAAAFLLSIGRPCRDTKLLAVLVGLTGGHPLHLQRIAASGVLEGMAKPGDGQLTTAIRAAVDDVPPPARSRLAHAAILGDEPFYGDAAVVCGVDPDTMRATVAEVAPTGLLAAPAGDRFHFGHSLIRETFGRTLTHDQRWTAHARAAGVLASRMRDGGGRDQPLTRYAHHCLCAAGRSVDDTRRAVAAARAAARMLIDGFAYEEAASLLAAAVAAGEQQLPAPVPAELLTDWAEAVLMCGRLAEARGLFDRAVVAAEEAGDMVLLARAGLGLGGVWINEHRTTVAWERVAGLQRRALDGLDPAEAGLRRRLRTRLMVEELYRGRGTVDAVREAVAETRRLGDTRALAEALSLCHHALLTATHCRERLSLAEELIAVAATSGDGLLALIGLCWRTVDLFHLGDLRAVGSLAELTDRLEALGCLSVRYVADCMSVMLLIRAGRLAEAEAGARSCLDLGTRVGDADAVGYFGTHLGTIRWLQGREAEVIGEIGQLIDSPTLNPAEFGFRATEAYLDARVGETRQAREILTRLTERGLSTLPDSSTWLAGISVIAQTAAILGDAALAREAYELLGPHAELPIVPSLAVVCFGSVHRPLGLAAATFDDLPQAIRHFESAVAANRRLGNRPLTAIAAADLAGALTRRGRADDRDRARTLLAGAVEEADDIGMTGYATSWRTELSGLTERIGRIDRHRRHWEIRLDGRQATIADRRGVQYLAQLLLNPGVEVPAAALAGVVVETRSAQPVLDPASRSAYRRRIEDLSAEVRLADVHGDPARSERAREEMLALAEELQRATGRGGRDRAFAGAGERARTAVRKAIKRAIDEIAAADPELGAELGAAITTGATCCYRPSDATRWKSRTF